MTRKLYGRLETQYKLSPSGIDINLTIYQKTLLHLKMNYFPFFLGECLFLFDIYWKTKQNDEAISYLL
jgi:hypothetical protein